jgi:hypothetical protein
MAAPFVGLLVLDTRFPRLPGDAGRPDSYPMPVRARTVAGATPARVVQQADAALIGPFVDAARALVAEGAAAITTSCGFLVRWQAELQAALPVPVWSSSLLVLPALKRPGIVTADAAALAGVAAAAGVPRVGLAPGGHLHGVLLGNQPVLDAAQAERDAVAAALALLRENPDLTDVVLECTNLPPFAAAIERATARPVHHLVALVTGRWKALHP